MQNFIDHNPIGDSDVFVPITISGARIRPTELTLRSPRFWSAAQVYVTYFNQTADGFGAITGGLTDFSPPSHLPSNGTLDLSPQLLMVYARAARHTCAMTTTARTGRLPALLLGVLAATTDADSSFSGSVSVTRTIAAR